MTQLLSRPLILASASPRRAELLRQLGIDFTVSPAHVEEPLPRPGEELLQWVRKAAEDKARASATGMTSAPRLILGADTVVVLPDSVDANAPRFHGSGADILGKPVDAEDARRMLFKLSGREHMVLSGFALIAHPEGNIVSEVVETHVHFRQLTRREIDDYVASGEPLDKAGAYGIQGRGAVFITAIQGDYYTVVGLPLSRLWAKLMQWMV